MTHADFVLWILTKYSCEWVHNKWQKKVFGSVDAER